VVVFLEIQMRDEELFPGILFAAIAHRLPAAPLRILIRAGVARDGYTFFAIDGSSKG